MTGIDQARGARRPDVPGHILSCYTNILGAALAYYGIDPMWWVGSQFFLAVRDDSTTGPSFVFSHYHTPLFGDGSATGWLLQWRGCDVEVDAAARLVADVRDYGPVIVSGDTFNLPWHVGHAVRHAPHWFLVDAAEDSRIRVHDPLRHSDDLGDQVPHEGWYSTVTLSELLGVYGHRSGPAYSREVWASGRAAPGGSERFQWLVTVREPSAPTMDEGLVRSLLDTSFEHLANPGKRSDFTDQRWSTGQDALEVLRTRSVEYLAVPELYDISEDLWVAGRTRELWVQTLRRAAAEHGLDVAGALAQRVEERVLGNWRALSQLARYNRTYLARGRRPRMAFAEILGHLADEEGALVEEYGGMFT